MPRPNFARTHPEEKLTEYDGSRLILGSSALIVPTSRFHAAASFVVAAMHGNPIVGTDAGERIEGTSGPDDIEGRGGNDSIFGRPGDDYIEGNDGSDGLHGGWGDDTLIGGLGNDGLIGGPGADALSGGAGNDRYYVDDPGDAVVEFANEGLDSVYSRVDLTLGAGVEILRLAGDAARGTGNDLNNFITGAYGLASTLLGLGGNDLIRGSTRMDHIEGGTGNDTLEGMSGDDTIYGGDGNDRIEGGLGVDRLYGDAGDDEIFGSLLSEISGGSGNDRLIGGRLIDGGDGNDRIFASSASNVISGGAGRDVMLSYGGADIFAFDDGDFAGLTGNTADRIWDFSTAQKDRIDLSAVDAIPGGADDMFDYIGNAEFSGTAGELRWEHGNSQSMVYMDVDGDMVADYAINLLSNVALTEASFIL